MNLRQSHLLVLCAVARCPVSGNYQKGAAEVYRSLERRGFIDRRASAWGYFLTPKGATELRAHGLCDRCGSYRSNAASIYQAQEASAGGLHWRWERCVHLQPVQGVP
jgi:hypothetical protein